MMSSLLSYVVSRTIFPNLISTRCVRLQLPSLAMQVENDGSCNLAYLDAIRIQKAALPFIFSKAEYLMKIVRWKENPPASWWSWSNFQKASVTLHAYINLVLAPSACWPKLVHGVTNDTTPLLKIVFTSPWR